MREVVEGRCFLFCIAISEALKAVTLVPRSLGEVQMGVLLVPRSRGGGCDLTCY